VHGRRRACFENPNKSNAESRIQKANAAGGTAAVATGTGAIPQRWEKAGRNCRFFPEKDIRSHLFPAFPATSHLFPLDFSFAKRGLEVLPDGQWGSVECEIMGKNYGFLRIFPRFYAQIRAVFTRFYAFLRVRPFLSMMSQSAESNQYCQEAEGHLGFEVWG